MDNSSRQISIEHTYNEILEKLKDILCDIRLEQTFFKLGLQGYDNISVISYKNYVFLLNSLNYTLVNATHLISSNMEKRTATKESICNDIVILKMIMECHKKTYESYNFIKELKYSFTSNEPKQSSYIINIYEDIIRKHIRTSDLMISESEKKIHINYVYFTAKNIIKNIIYFLFSSAIYTDKYTENIYFNFYEDLVKSSNNDTDFYVCCTNILSNVEKYSDKYTFIINSIQLYVFFSDLED